jgi:hypothetical protein
MAAAVRVRRQATVSDWENPKDPDREHPVPPGALRLAADLCHNDREVFRWLEEGGTMPAVLRISNPAPSEPTGLVDGDARFSEGYRAGFKDGLKQGASTAMALDAAASDENKRATIRRVTSRDAKKGTPGKARKKGGGQG